MKKISIYIVLTFSQLVLYAQIMPVNGSKDIYLRSILQYMHSNRDSETDAIISGQMIESGISPEIGFDSSFVKMNTITSEWFGILGVKYDNSKSSYMFDNKRLNKLITDYSRKKGIVLIEFLLKNPWTELSAEDRSQIGDFNDLINDETDIGRKFLKMLDSIVISLKELKDSNVVVLFKPLPLMNTNVYWWGNNPQFADLWKFILNYFSFQKGLSNLLWVYSTQVYHKNDSLTKNEVDFYPGTDYVDIIGLEEENDSLVINNFNQLKNLNKPLALTKLACSKSSAKFPYNFDFYNLFSNFMKKYKKFAFFIFRGNYLDADSNRIYSGLYNQNKSKELLNDNKVINREDLKNIFDDKFLIVYPLNNQKIPNISKINLKWDFNENYKVLGYKLMAGLDSELVNVTGYISNKFQAVTLIRGTKYYWKVIAKAIELKNDNTDTIEIESKIFSFTVDSIGTLDRIKRRSPANHSVIKGNIVGLSAAYENFDNFYGYYVFCYSYDPFFINYEITQDNDRYTQQVYVPSCKKLYWLVKYKETRFSYDLTDWSEVWEISGPQPKTDYNITWPRNKEIVHYPDSLEFIWELAREYKYDGMLIEFSKSDKFLEKYSDSSFNLNKYNYFLIPNEIRKQLGDTVYWRVKVKYCNGWQQYSDTYVFYIYKQTPINVEENSKSNLLSISPNPATDFIEISYSPLEKGVRGLSDDIKIYNVFGEEVTTPLLRSTPPYEGGENSSSQYSLLNTQYSAKIDVSGFTPGVYFVRVGEKVIKFLKI